MPKLQDRPAKLQDKNEVALQPAPWNGRGRYAEWTKSSGAAVKNLAVLACNWLSRSQIRGCRLPCTMQPLSNLANKDHTLFVSSIFLSWKVHCRSTGRYAVCNPERKTLPAFLPLPESQPLSGQPILPSTIPWSQLPNFRLAHLDSFRPVEVGSTSWELLGKAQALSIRVLSSRATHHW